MEANICEILRIFLKRPEAEILAFAYAQMLIYSTYSKQTVLEINYHYFNKLKISFYHLKWSKIYFDYCRRYQFKVLGAFLEG